jgi:hypothetical protein
MSLPICSSLVDEYFRQLPASGLKPTSQLLMALWLDGANVMPKKQLMLMARP